MMDPAGHVALRADLGGGATGRASPRRAPSTRTLSPGDVAEARGLATRARRGSSLVIDRPGARDDFETAQLDRVVPTGRVLRRLAARSSGDLLRLAQHADIGHN